MPQFVANQYETGREINRPWAFFPGERYHTLSGRFRPQGCGNGVEHLWRQRARSSPPTPALSNRIRLPRTVCSPHRKFDPLPAACASSAGPSPVQAGNHRSTYHMYSSKITFTMATRIEAKVHRCHALHCLGWWRVGLGSAHSRSTTKRAPSGDTRDTAVGTIVLNARHTQKSTWRASLMPPCRTNRAVYFNATRNT